MQIPLWATELSRLPVNRERGFDLTPYAAALNDPRFVEAIEGALRLEPTLVNEWWTMSGDRRGSPAPYFGLSDDIEVGFYDDDGGLCDVVQHTDPIRACTDYIYRLTFWVLERRRVTPLAPVVGAEPPT